MPGVTEPILQVKDLRTSFFTDDGEVKAVRGVSFDLYQGETLGIVGESGCGKSVTVMSLLGLVQRPGRVTGGEVLFQGKDLIKISPEELRHVRGRDISMIFQDPLSSLNPVMTVGFQIDEGMFAHDVIAHDDVKQRGIELLSEVRVPDPARRIKDYPHQFSGGMRQRAMIAMALGNRPKVLIADEPTTALDVTVQAQILELLRDLNKQTGTSIVLITHNLGVVAGLCQRVIVMYAGEIVEEGTVDQIFANPQHPYTWSLLRSMPRVDTSRKERLRSIEGLPPDLIAPPPGCKFNPRCPFRIEKCFTDEPKLELVGTDSQRAACWVRMDGVYAEIGGGDIIDTRPGAVSGVRPPKDLAPHVEDEREMVAPEAAPEPVAKAGAEVVGDVHGS